MNYSDIQTLIRHKLEGIYPGREIDSIGFLVAAHLTGQTRAGLLLNRDQALTGDQVIRLNEMADRLLLQEPVQYVIGETEFCGLTLRVRPGVLIPRGETEELVGWVVEKLPAKDGRQKSGEHVEPLTLLDIGCGSGAIALGLKNALPEADVFAADISPDALQVTQENARFNALQINCFRFDVLRPERFGELPGNRHFDAIVSNPPYIPLAEKAEVPAHVKNYEPESALFVPDEDPLIFYRAIAEFAQASLAPGGQVFVEIHQDLSKETADLFRNYFPIVEIRRDIHGKNRMIRAYHG